MNSQTKPLRVLHLFANLNLGGAESRIMDLFRSQDAKVLINDFVIMTDQPCYYSDEVRQAGGVIHIISSPHDGLLNNMKQLYCLLKTAPQYDAIHAHTSYYSGFVVFLARLAGLKGRVTHARNQQVGIQSYSAKILFTLGQWLCNVFASRKLAISASAGEFLYGASAKFSVVANAFDFHAIRHKLAAAVLPDRAVYHMSPDAIHLVAVARFYPIKNHAFMIDLLKALTSQGHNCQLHLIGDGELRAEIEAQVVAQSLSESVRFWGKRNDVAQLLSLFDVMVMPSHSEGLGVSALEAQAAGLPCVLSSTIPQEADIGAKLCQYLRLSQPIDDWVAAIIAAANTASPTKSALDGLFQQRGYSLAATRQAYLEAYR